MGLLHLSPKVLSFSFRSCLFRCLRLKRQEDWSVSSLHHSALSCSSRQRYLYRLFFGSFSRFSFSLSLSLSFTASITFLSRKSLLSSFFFVLSLLHLSRRTLPSLYTLVLIYHMARQEEWKLPLHQNVSFIHFSGGRRHARGSFSESLKSRLQILSWGCSDEAIVSQLSHKNLLSLSFFILVFIVSGVCHPRLLLFFLNLIDLFFQWSQNEKEFPLVF